MLGADDMLLEQALYEAPVGPPVGRLISAPGVSYERLGALGACCRSCETGAAPCCGGRAPSLFGLPLATPVSAGPGLLDSIANLFGGGPSTDQRQQNYGTPVDRYGNVDPSVQQGAGVVGAVGASNVPGIAVTQSPEGPPELTPVGGASVDPHALSQNLLPGGAGTGLSLPGLLLAAGGAGAAAGTILTQEDLGGRSHRESTLEKKELRSIAGGAGGGAIAGAAIGSMVPVVGTILGAVVGGALGAGGALFSSEQMKRKNKKLQTRERLARTAETQAALDFERSQAAAKVDAERKVAAARASVTVLTRQAPRLAISVRQLGGDGASAQALQEEAEAIGLEASTSTDTTVLDSLRAQAQAVLEDLRALEAAAKSSPQNRGKLNLKGLFLGGLAGAPTNPDDYVFAVRRANRAKLGLTPQATPPSPVAVVVGGALVGLAALELAKALKRRKRR